MEFQLAAFKVAAFCLAAVGTLSLPVLLALILAKSRLHWLFQSLPIFAVACPLIFVGAFDLMLIVLVAAFSVLICSNIWQRRLAKKLESANASLAGSPEQPRIQMGLKDGFAVFVLLGVLAALLAQSIDADIWAGNPGPIALGLCRCILIGGAIAAWGTSLLVLRVLKRRRARFLWLTLLAPFSVVAGWNTGPAQIGVQTWRYSFATDFSYLFNIPSVSKFQSTLGWTVLLASVALTVALMVWLFRGRSEKHRKTELAGVPLFQRNWAIAGKRMFASLWLLLSLTSIIYFYIALLPPVPYSPKKPLVPGSPNSFADLRAAGTALKNKGLTGYPPINPGPILAGKIKAESKLFEKIELALQAENCFCIDWSLAQMDSNETAGQELREVARGLSERALQSLGDGRHDDVVADGLLCLKVADASATDGALIHSLIGTAIEGIGIGVAIPGIEGASAEQLKKAAMQLDEKIAFYGDADAEMERLIKADRHYARSSFLNHWLEALQASFLSESSSHEQVRESLERRNVNRELFRTEVAIAWYRLEMGRFPDSLESLVPKFLSNVPKDRYSKTAGQSLQYVAAKNGESYRLYSVGRNGVDDNGEVDKENWYEHGDLDLKILEGNRLADVAQEVAEEAERQAKIKEEQEAWEEGWEEEEENWAEDFLEEMDEGMTEQPKIE